MKSRPRMHSLRWLHLLPIGAVACEYFYKIKVVNGRSMQPTLNPDWLLSRDVGVFDVFSVQAKHHYTRGDVVALVSPMNPERMLIKRILAVEGDVVQTLPPYPDPTVIIPKGHVWVEGDESFRTDDSNRFGPVPSALIESKLISIIWPLNRFGVFRSKPSINMDGLDEPSRRHQKDAVDRDRWRDSRVVRRPGQSA
ncbi:hypothetical protein HGRIS_009731 [Hohenbuehelia grisea]|uniref:Mitochondrial inner membrane protease subunit 2 n=1 Tax=Hohenbuehelia grisea TaxID=104357 RepID=A0ABR3J280_9AGAR